MKERQSTLSGRFLLYNSKTTNIDRYTGRGTNKVYHKSSCAVKNLYCLSKKSCPILYRKLLHKFGHDFLDIQYICVKIVEGLLSPVSLNGEGKDFRLFTASQSQGQGRD